MTLLLWEKTIQLTTCGFLDRMTPNAMLKLSNRPTPNSCIQFSVPSGIAPIFDCQYQTAKLFCRSPHYSAAIHFSFLGWRLIWAPHALGTQREKKQKEKSQCIHNRMSEQILIHQRRQKRETWSRNATPNHPLVMVVACALYRWNKKNQMKRKHARPNSDWKMDILCVPWRPILNLGSNMHLDCPQRLHWTPGVVASAC